VCARGAARFSPQEKGREITIMAGRLSIFMRLGRNIIPVNGDGDAYRSHGEKSAFAIAFLDLSSRTHSADTPRCCLFAFRLFFSLSLILFFFSFLRPLIVFEF
jgi:hypothetical protein